MTLNGGNVPLAEINKNSGAHQKYFNEVRPILSTVKCRPMIVVPNKKIYQVYADTYTGWLKIKYPTRQYAISSQSVVRF